jgi:hypothetical protein
MAKNNNRWFIICGLILIFFFIIFLIFYRYINITLYNKYMNIDTTKQNEYDYDYDDYDENNIKQNNIIIIDNDLIELQKTNVNDIDRTLTKYLNLDTFDTSNNLYEHFDSITSFDVSINVLDINENLPDNTLSELYSDLLLTIPITLKNKLINCQSEINNKLLIKQNVLCILSQFFYWWIEEIIIPENNSIIEKNMLLIILILFLINDEKINIKDIINYNSNDKTVTFVSSNLKKLLENVLNITINTDFINDKIKTYQKTFLVQNEKDQNNFIDIIKKNVINSYIELQKNPTIKIKSTNNLITNINYLNSNLNDDMSFDELTSNLFSMNIEINKIFNKLNVLNRLINNNIFIKNDATELRNKIKSIIVQLKNINSKIIEVNNKIKIIEIKRLYKYEVDTSQNTLCTREYKPVCGINNITYNNNCEARKNNVKILYNGACNKDDILIKENNNGNGNVRSIKDNIEHMTDCSSNIDYVCGINNQTYDNSCKANVTILHKGRCNTIEEDSNNKSNAINSFKESLNNIKNIIPEINNIQKKIFDIIKEYNNRYDKEKYLNYTKIILPDTISITYLIKILKKLFILSRSSVNTSCNCMYDENYDFKFVHTDYIANYLI